MENFLKDKDIPIIVDTFLKAYDDRKIKESINNESFSFIITLFIIAFSDILLNARDLTDMYGVNLNKRETFKTLRIHSLNIFDAI